MHASSVKWTDELMGCVEGSARRSGIGGAGQCDRRARSPARRERGWARWESGARSRYMRADRLNALGYAWGPSRCPSFTRVRRARTHQNGGRPIGATCQSGKSRLSRVTLGRGQLSIAALAAPALSLECAASCRPGGMQPLTNPCHRSGTGTALLTLKAPGWPRRGRCMALTLSRGPVSSPWVQLPFQQGGASSSVFASKSVPRLQVRTSGCPDGMKRNSTVASRT
jgi:hypothetical protein